jgi:hypothetical protein
MPLNGRPLEEEEEEEKGHYWTKKEPNQNAECPLKTNWMNQC